MPKTVLLVDDSAMMRKIITKHLREAGFTDIVIEEAGDGDQGLERFKAGGIDVVLTDWNMPNMDGLTLVKEIRKLDPQKKIPVMMITSEATAAKVKEAIVAGANNYLSKPFEAPTLKAKLESVLG